MRINTESWRGRDPEFWFFQGLNTSVIVTFLTASMMGPDVISYSSLALCSFPLLAVIIVLMVDYARHSHDYYMLVERGAYLFETQDQDGELIDSDLKLSVIHHLPDIGPPPQLLKGRELMECARNLYGITRPSKLFWFLLDKELKELESF